MRKKYVARSTLPAFLLSGLHSTGTLGLLRLRLGLVSLGERVMAGTMEPSQITYGFAGTRRSCSGSRRHVASLGLQVACRAGLPRPDPPRRCTRARRKLGLLWIRPACVLIGDKSCVFAAALKHSFGSCKPTGSATLQHLWRGTCSDGFASCPSCGEEGLHFQSRHQ